MNSFREELQYLVWDLKKKAGFIHDRQITAGDNYGGYFRDFKLLSCIMYDDGVLAM